MGVVIFHAFPNALRGGFVGVDIFFVISGFLISSIIFDELDTNSFSIATFYGRRVRRIFPALLIVLASTLIAGRLLLTGADLKQLALQVVAGIGFFSNLLSWSEIGYFDVAAETKPLLHLWSLGVEEQFYAVWPLLLWATNRLRWSKVAVVLVVVIASFATCIILAKGNFLDAFYLPQARIWQLGFGGLLAILVRSNFFERVGATTASYRSVIGLTLVAIGLATAGQSYPGWRALFPTAGAVLIISGGANAWVNRSLLSQPILVWTGLISYPLYLWHWPLLVFPRIAVGHQLSPSTRLLLMQASIALAWLTYRFVEKPLRFGRSTRQMWNVVLPCAAVVLAGVALGAAWRASNSPVADERAALTQEQQQLVADLEYAESTRDTFQNLYGPKPCFKWRVDQTIDMFVENGCLDIADPKRDTAFLIGDSHGASLSLGLRPFFAERNMNFLQVSTGFCEPTSVNPNDNVCIAINEEVLRRIKTIRPTMVILDSSWMQAVKPPYFFDRTSFYRHFLAFISKLHEHGAERVVVIGQIPTWEKALPDILMEKFVLKNLPVPERTFEGVVVESLAFDDVMRSLKYPEGTTYVSLRDVLCDEAGCLTHVGPSLATDITVWDYGHLTVSGAVYVTRKAFEPVFQTLVRAAR
jgi:peptidoglycan/LPS O-acetylase OafA/YrhL